MAYRPDSIPDWHPLLSATRLDGLDQRLDLRILNAKVEGAGLPIGEFLRRFVVLEFEHLDADFVTGGEVGDFEGTPSFSKNVDAHLPNGCFLFFDDHGWLHDRVPAHDLLVKTDGFFEIRDGDPNVRECFWIGFHLC